jgi:hypothetical protein
MQIGRVHRLGGIEPRFLVFLENQEHEILFDLGPRRCSQGVSVNTHTCSIHTCRYTCTHFPLFAMMSVSHVRGGDCFFILPQKNPKKSWRMNLELWASIVNKGKGVRDHQS